MRTWLAIAMLLGLCRPWVAAAAKLAPFLEGPRLAIALGQVALPAALRTDVRSGLTNRILIRFELLRDGQMVAKEAVDVAVKYDLWDENFQFTASIEGLTVISRTLTSVDEVLQAITNLRLPGLFPVDNLPDSTTLQVTAEILFDPVEKARLDEVKKWVAENSSPPPEAPVVGTGAQPGDPRPESRSVFNRIFAQFAAGASVAAAARDAGASATFRLKDLPRAQP